MDVIPGAALNLQEEMIHLSNHYHVSITKSPLMISWFKKEQGLILTHQTGFYISWSA